jgi:viologen exporter family transport system permease protein
VDTVLGTVVRPYLAIFAARFSMLLQYRAAALAGIVTQFWFGAIMVMALAAFYGSGRGAPSITLAQAVTYIWLGQAFLGLLPWNVDTEIAAMMRSGNVAYERLRPVDTYFYWFARALAWRTAGTLLRSIPLLVATSVLFPAMGLGDWSLRPPPGLKAFALFALSMVAVLLLSSAITTLLNISVIWTVSGQGINAISNSLVVILSGMVIPLPLFPDWAQAFLFAQPLAGLVDIPYRIYFANLSGPAALGGIGLQTLWTLLLIGLGRLLMTRTMSRVQVQGG